MLIVLIVVGVIILVIATLKYPPIALALFLTAGLTKGILMLEFGFFRVVDYTVLCAVLVLVAMAYSFVKSGGQMRDILSIPLVIYLLLATILLVATTYTSAPNYGLEKSSRFATLGLIAFLAPVVFAHSVKEVKLMMWILFAVGILLSIVTIIAPHEVVLRVAAETRGGFLEAGPLPTATQIGTAAVVAFIFAIMTHTSKSLRIASLALIALMMVGIIITASRGPLLGLGFTWLVAIFICRKGVSKAWLPLVAGAIVVGLVVSFTKLPEIVTARVATVWKSGYHMKEAAYARTEMFIWTVRRFPERPILGHGTGAFAIDRGGRDTRIYPHNIILEFLYEQGVVGAVIMSVFLLLIFRRWRQASRFVYLYELDIEVFQIVHIAGLLFLFLFTQAMKSFDINGNRLMFFSAGLVLAVFNLVRRTAEETSLQDEIIADGRQYSEGFESEDDQFLY